MIGMADALGFLLYPFVAALLLTGIHTYLGIHVLRRNIIFVDLALAQISALGATAAFMLGHPPQSAAAYGYALAFTLAGAVLLTLSRSWGGRVSQETFVGVIYVVSAAAAFLLVDKAPQGAEQIKQLLVGSLLTVEGRDIVRLATLYGAVGAFHWLFRRCFLAVSFEPDAARRQGVRLWFWDFLFYASFGVVVTSSVAVGGVLLVFSFLIIPAAIGALYFTRMAARLVAGWLLGTLASGLGLGASFAWDLPTGAAMVCTFGAMLALAALCKPLIAAPAPLRRSVARRFAAGGLATAAATLALSSAWLIVNPRADHPVLDMLEASVPAVRTAFLRRSEIDLMNDAVRDAEHYRQEARRLNGMERDSRWRDTALSDYELQRLTSYTKSFQEMRNGELFVQMEMRYRARERQRLALGVPMLMISLALLTIVWPRPRARGSHWLRDGVV